MNYFNQFKDLLAPLCVTHTAIEKEALAKEKKFIGYGLLISFLMGMPLFLGLVKKSYSLTDMLLCSTGLGLLCMFVWGGILCVANAVGVRPLTKLQKFIYQKIHSQLSHEDTQKDFLSVLHGVQIELQQHSVPQDLKNAFQDNLSQLKQAFALQNGKTAFHKLLEINDLLCKIHGKYEDSMKIRQFNDDFNSYLKHHKIEEELQTESSILGIKAPYLSSQQ